MRASRYYPLIYSLIALGFVAAASCSMAEAPLDAPTKTSPPPNEDGTGGTLGAGGSSAGPGADAGGQQPPEREIENLFEAPVATGSFVWIANPQSGRVALIDAKTFEVQTAVTGAGPRYLAKVPNASGRDLAVVINEVSNDGALLEAVPSGDISVQSFSIAQRANSWSISSDGKWAIAWGNHRLVQGQVPEVEGFQDVAVIDLSASPPASTRLSVGYRPSAVSFDVQHARAYVVTEDGISVIALGEHPHATKVIPFPAVATPVVTDVSFTPDGAYALIRYLPSAGTPSPDGGIPDAAQPDAPLDGSQPDGAETDATLPDAQPPDAGLDSTTESGSDSDASTNDAESGEDSDASSEPLDAGIDASGEQDSGATSSATSVVSILSLASGKVTNLTLPGVCTDLDLSPDGTLAVAALRDVGRVAIIPLPQAIDSPSAVEILSTDKATIGSVSMAAAAPVAFFYSNAVEENRLTYVNLMQAPHELHTTKLYAPVLGVFPASLGASAVIVHQDERSFSIQSIEPLLPAKIVGTQQPILSVALTKTGDRALVAERSEQAPRHGAYLVRTDNLQVDRYELSSPAVSVGMVEQARRGYVAQRYPEGRITFIDLDTGLARTLTGFEMGSQVIDGSHP